MSQRESKNQKKQAINQQSIPFKLDDFLSKTEKKSTEIDILLSSSQIEQLNAQHQLLISSASMSQVIRAFDKQIISAFQEAQSSEIIKLYQTWKEWMQNSIAKNNGERRQLVQRLVGNDDKEKRKNPADDYEKRKSHILSREIRQREQFFKIKTNFAAYAKSHFQKQTKQIKELVEFQAKRVQIKTIKQMFKKHEEQKFNEIAHTFSELQKEQQNRLLFLMRQGSKIKKLNEQKKLFLIGERQKNQMNLKYNACRQLGNSVSLLVNVHDAMIFSKK